MLDFPLMLQAKLPVVERIQPQSNKLATGALKLNDSSGNGGGGKGMDKEFIKHPYTLPNLHLGIKVRFGSWIKW